jgi:diaminopimelate decarboxylase
VKPIGPIPPWFNREGALVIGGRAAEELAGGGTPVFAYDATIVREKIASLRNALPAQVDLHYAIKANPFAPLLAMIGESVDGLDVASAGELRCALKVKPADAISFAGPGKRDAELTEAIAAGVTINLESEGEADRALRLADQTGTTPRLAVRVNPSFELRGSGMKMGGRPSPFGVDADRVPALVRHLLGAGADWRGFHIFAGSQSLDTQAIIETQSATLRLAAELADKVGAAPALLNLGGGFGVPYFAGDLPVDVDAIGAALGKAIALHGTAEHYAVELGRWIVAETGVYLTRVIDRKESGGEIFLVVDGGLHHQLAATGNFGTVVRRNYPVALARDVLGAAEETVSIVGPLCTPLDRLADRIGFSRAEVGDVIAVFLAGAYGKTASPEAFLGHPPARELLLG